MTEPSYRDAYDRNLATDGAPAFPGRMQNGFDPRSDCGEYFCGMSLRDWFAGQALAQLAMMQGIDKDYDNRIAKQCYALADAMLSAGRTK